MNEEDGSLVSYYICLTYESYMSMHMGIITRDIYMYTYIYTYILSMCGPSHAHIFNNI